MRYWWCWAWLLLSGCDMTLDVHDNPISLHVDACAMLNPVDTCTEESQSLAVPRAETEPCHVSAPCGDDLVCVCGVCLNTEDFQ